MIPNRIYSDDGCFHFRWVKYEELVEEGGKRWSKPHVASLSMQTMFNLRKTLKDAPIIIDYDCHTLSQVIGR